MYINTKTGERTYQHPCDEYYQQLVIQERKKRGAKLFGSKKPAPQSQLQSQPAAQKFPANNPIQVMAQPKQIVVDPLVKMQQ